MKTDHLDDMLRRNQNSLLTVFMNPKFRAVVRDRLAFPTVGVLFLEILVKRNYTDLRSAGKDWSANDRRPSSVA